MGFLDSLLKKGGGKTTPADIDEIDPKDAKKLQDLAFALKGKGEISGAVVAAQKAAAAHKGQGFNQKALGLLKSAAQWDPKDTATFESLAELYLQLKLKEDARGAFLALKKLYQSGGHADELAKVEAKIAELGPGR